jgi:hypothetical protein
MHTPNPPHRQKTYFIISSVQYGPLLSNLNGDVLEITLPPYFGNSQIDQKYIEVRNVKIIIDDALVNDVKFHSTIVRENAYDDHFICFTNELMVKPKKYEWDSTGRTIQIWFTNMRNTKIDAVDYLIELMLWY